MQGPLEIIHEAVSRAISPATSIPETIADTIVDSQSQQQEVDSEDTREISGTVDTIENSSQVPQVPTEDEVLDVNREDEQQTVTQSGDLGQEDEEGTVLGSAIRASPSIQVDSLQTVVSSRNEQEEDDRQNTREVRASPETAERALHSPSGTAERKSQQRRENSSCAARSTSREEQPQEDLDVQTFSAANTPSGAGGAASQSDSRSCQASLNEELSLYGNARPALHSHHPNYNSTPPQQIAIQDNLQENDVCGVLVIASIERFNNEATTGQTGEVHFQAHAESTIPESSNSASQLVKQPEIGLASLSQEPGLTLPNSFAESNYVDSLSTATSQKQHVREQATVTVQQLIDTANIPDRDTVRCQDFASEPQVPQSPAHSTGSREQNAQVLPIITDSSTQSDAIESIRPTIEEEYIALPASSRSRHDSSQESPERQFKLVENSFSPIPLPPSYSLGTLGSRIPSRPVTPVQISPLSVMATRDTGAEVAQELEERLAKRQAENPFTPSTRLIRSSFTPSAQAPSAPAAASIATSVPEASAPSLTSAKRLLQPNTSPVAALEGTRSPSTVPDRSPAPQPTSLRTVASAFSSSVPAAPLQGSDMAATTSGRSETINVDAMVTAEDAVLPLDMPEATEPEDEELSDADADEDSNESLLNDDLSLDREEYIVPLFIEGRQRDMYSEHIQHKKEDLEKFLKDPRGYNPLSQIEEVLSYLRAVETHVDLVFAEAESSSGLETDSATQVEFAAQFGMENSTKFRFLHSLFHYLQGYRKHVVLVTERDHDPLFNILETFCKAKMVDYNMPTKGRRADPATVEGTLLITIFPSKESPIIQAPDLIICLDGVQEASQIRRKNWARSSNKDIVPVLHLVTPRTVGHIERYISPALDIREHMHTTLASLAQIRLELGRPIDDETPRAPVAAMQVGNWLTANKGDEGLSWPLPSIGSVKDVIEYQTQMSQVSDTPPAPERTKRPLVSQLI